MVKMRLIGSVLNPALRLWLRSQVEEAQEIHVQVEAGDGQLLTGKIPQVSVRGVGVVYQGLHLTDVRLVAQHIAVNLGQVMRGKPLRLLESIAAWGQLVLAESDLQASLASSLLCTVLGELLDQWVSPLVEQQLLDAQYHRWDDITIQFQPDRLVLMADLVQLDPQTCGEYQRDRLSLGARVGIEDAQTIGLWDLDWHCERSSLVDALKTTQHLTLKLGSDTTLETVTLTTGSVTCALGITIQP